MADQNFVYIDVNYLKELEEKAKKVDYFKGVIDGIMMCKREKAPELDGMQMTLEEYCHAES